MAEDKPAGKRHPGGNITPEQTEDTSEHRQQRLFESENRANRAAPIEDEEAADKEGERTVGDSPGKDTSRAVAEPAELNKPGASTKLGGTPGANATRTGGRQTD